MSRAKGQGLVTEIKEIIETEKTTEITETGMLEIIGMEVADTTMAGERIDGMLETTENKTEITVISIGATTDKTPEEVTAIRTAAGMTTTEEETRVEADRETISSEESVLVETNVELSTLEMAIKTLNFNLSMTTLAKAR